MPRITSERRERQRQRILDAALACFDRTGLHRTTVHDIIAEAGLSTGTIYLYFDGKEAIIEAIAAERHARERALLRTAIDSDDPRASLRTFLDEYFAWLTDPDEQRRRRVNVHVWAEALNNPRVHDVIVDGLGPRADAARAIRRAQRRGTLPKHVDADAFTRTVLALIQGLVLQQAWEPDLDVTRYKRTALALLDTFLGDAAVP